MSLEAFAVSDDIEAVWRPLTAAEAVQATGLIAQASRKLRTTEVPGVDGIIAAGVVEGMTQAQGTELLAGIAKDAVVNAVKRVLMNPDGWRERSITTGPMSESGTVDTALSSALLYFTEDDLKGLVPTPAGFRSFRVRSGYHRRFQADARR